MNDITIDTKIIWRILLGDKTFNVDHEHQYLLLKLVLLCAIPTLFTFAALNSFIGFKNLAWVQFVSALVFAPLLLSFYRAKKISAQRMETIILCVIIVTFHSLILFGGHRNTGIHWVGIFPFLVFFLVGLYRGWPWVFAFLFIAIINACLSIQGLLDIPYDLHTLILFASTFLFYTLIAAIFAGMRERYQLKLKQSNQALAEAHNTIMMNNQTLEQQVQQRTAELNKEVQKHKATNIALQHKEEQFQQAQKMEALGTLIGGFAHDFNNMLSGINANLFMVKRSCNDNSGTKKRLEDVEKLIFYASDMIKQLLIFARKDHLKLNIFNATPFFSEAYKLAELSIPETITLQSNFPHEKLYIKGNTTQLQQVMMNLINNAKDALSHTENPTIHIQLEHVQLDNAFKEHHPSLQHTDYAKLSVFDNGSGIDKGKLEKIFEPFFTTKEAGKGTGLGLAMCYGAMQSHQGSIDVQSGVGKGTTFSIYLPLQTTPCSHAHHDSKKELQQGNGETILIVDDDATLRIANSQALHALGYKTRMASNGMEAIEVFQKYQADIQLILMDIMMPVMGGVEAAENIHQTQANIAILFTTGHDKERTLDANHPLQTGQHVLNKPFNVEQLTEAIQQYLRKL